MWYWILFYSIILSLNDIASFGLVKTYALRQVSVVPGLILPMLLYSLQMPLFFQGLRYTTMAILNISWNLVSNIVVTLVGIFYFREKITHLRSAAILLALSSLALFSFDAHIEG